MVTAHQADVYQKIRMNEAKIDSINRRDGLRNKWVINQKGEKLLLLFVPR
jgi:hypothetical protein